MTGEEKLQTILNGQIPDSPPHGELVFQMDFAVRLFERPKELHAEAREKCDRAKTLYYSASTIGKARCSKT